MAGIFDATAWTSGPLGLFATFAAMHRGRSVPSLPIGLALALAGFARLA